LGFVYGGGIQSLACDLVVHGYEEATTEYEELLDEGRFIFPLPHHIKNHVLEAVYSFDKMFSYH
jgi:hypothetical protein